MKDRGGSMKGIVLISLLLVVILAILLFTVWSVSSSAEQVTANYPALHAAILAED